MDFRQLLPQGLLGNGMAGMAAQAIQSRPYQLHIQEAKAMGQPPLPYEEWMKMQQQTQARGLLSQ